MQKKEEAARTGQLLCLIELTCPFSRAITFVSRAIIFVSRAITFMSRAITFMSRTIIFVSRAITFVLNVYSTLTRMTPLILRSLPKAGAGTASDRSMRV